MDLVGAWRLVEWRIGAPGSGVSYPFGRDAVGLLCYTPDGYMSMTVSRDGHATSPAGTSRGAPPEPPAEPLPESSAEPLPKSPPKPLPESITHPSARPPTVSPTGSPAGSPAEASPSFLSYAGRYEIREGQIAHDVELSLDRSVAGVVQVRELNVNGDHLVLAASERGSWHTMIWRRS